MWLTSIEYYGLLNTLHYSTQTKEKQKASWVIYFTFFTFLFILAKFDIYPYDVTNSYITNCHTNLAYMGLAKIIVGQVGTGSLFFKDAG